MPLHQKSFSRAGKKGQKGGGRGAELSKWDPGTSRGRVKWGGGDGVMVCERGVLWSDVGGGRGGGDKQTTKWHTQIGERWCGNQKKRIRYKIKGNKNRAIERMGKILGMGSKSGLKNTKGRKYDKRGPNNHRTR